MVVFPCVDIIQPKLLKIYDVLLAGRAGSATFSFLFNLVFLHFV